MPEALQPDSRDAVIADLSRRLQVLEATQRVGLSRVRLAWQTATAATSTYDPTWDSGTVGNTWADDQGATGTGFPRVSLITGRKVLVFASGTALTIANDVNYRTFAWRLGVGLDGNNPRNTRPFWSVYQTHGPTTEGNNAVQLVVAGVDLEPGEHEFKVRTKWTSTNPAAPNVPSLDDAFLAVIPID